MTQASTETPTISTDNFICPNCGGSLKHDAHKDKFLCASCGFESEIAPPAEDVKEFSFDGYAEREAASTPFTSMSTATCQTCGNQIAFEASETAKICPMCGSTQISSTKQKAGIAPGGIIPFRVDKQDAAHKFTEWVKGLWFAPNRLKQSYQGGHLAGRFVPFWTFDADVMATYTGQGGRYRKVKDSEGNERTETDWYPTGGIVQTSYDDELICACKDASTRLDMEQVGPFDTINELRPFAPEYIAGYSAELYSVKADAAFDDLKGRKQSDLVSLASADINRRFDTSRNVHVNAMYTNVTYKHVLLPVWTSIFSYNGKTYRYVVNGATGKVHGERPYSAIKIIAAIAVALGVLFGGFALFSGGEEMPEEAAAAGIATVSVQLEPLAAPSTPQL